MTTYEKLTWLIKHAHQVIVTSNDNRPGYQTIREYLEEYKVEEELIARCEAAGAFVDVQVYPSTPIGFYSITRPELDEAIDVAYESTRKELGL